MFGPYFVVILVISAYLSGVLISSVGTSYRVYKISTVVYLSAALYVGSTLALESSICLECLDLQTLNGQKIARSWRDDKIYYKVVGDLIYKEKENISLLLAELEKYTGIKFIPRNDHYQLLFIVHANSYKKIGSGSADVELPANPQIASTVRSIAEKAQSVSQPCSHVDVSDGNLDTVAAVLVSNGVETSCIERDMKGILGMQRFKNSEAADMFNLCLLYTTRRVGVRSPDKIKEFLHLNPQACSINSAR